MCRTLYIRRISFIHTTQPSKIKYTIDHQESERTPIWLYILLFKGSNHAEPPRREHKSQNLRKVSPSMQ